jgi:hypothetical protein
MASYRLLAPHFVGSRYLEADSVVVEGVDIPVGWVPSLSVDPLDGDAAQKFWNQLPGPLLSDSEFAWPGGSRFSNVSKPAPVTYWKKIDNDTFILTGLGASLGPRVRRPLFMGLPPQLGPALKFNFKGNSMYLGGP